MQLTERRKKDRAVMVQKLKELATELGIKADVTLQEGAPNNTISPRETVIRFADDNGLIVSIGIDGKSLHPDVHLVSWRSRDRAMSEWFGDVNPFHRHKASKVAYGFASLLDELRRGYGLSKTGEAYQ